MIVLHLIPIVVKENELKAKLPDCLSLFWLFMEYKMS